MPAVDDATGVAEKPTPVAPAGGTSSPRAGGGDAHDLFRFTGPHAFADGEIWRLIEARLTALRTAGQFGVSIVDAGCGAGTWLLRTALRTRCLGFVSVEGRSFDSSAGSVGLARRSAAAIAAPEMVLSLVIADIGEGLVVDEKSPADIVLCLSGMMNDLPPEHRPEIARALSAAGRSLFVTAQTAPPENPVARGEGVYDLQPAGNGHRETQDFGPRPPGSPASSITVPEFLAVFAPHGDIFERIWLDLHPTPPRAGFPDPATMAADNNFAEAAAWLGRRGAEDPSCLDRAAHVLLHLRQRLEEVRR